MWNRKTLLEEKSESKNHQKIFIEFLLLMTVNFLAEFASISTSVLFSLLFCFNLELHEPN